MTTLKQLVDDIDPEFTDAELHRLEFFRWKIHRRWIDSEGMEWFRLAADELSRNQMAKNRAAIMRLIPEIKEIL